MNNNNSKTIVWDNIPEWAIFLLEYGIDEELFLPDEDKEMITKFIVENFPNGYTMSVDWESYNEFDTNQYLNSSRSIQKNTIPYLKPIAGYGLPSVGIYPTGRKCVKNTSANAP